MPIRTRKAKDNELPACLPWAFRFSLFGKLAIEEDADPESRYNSCIEISGCFGKTTILLQGHQFCRVRMDRDLKDRRPN